MCVCVCVCVCVVMSYDLSTANPANYSIIFLCIFMTVCSKACHDCSDSQHSLTALFYTAIDCWLITPLYLLVGAATTASIGWQSFFCKFFVGIFIFILTFYIAGVVEPVSCFSFIPLLSCIYKDNTALCFLHFLFCAHMSPDAPGRNLRSTECFLWLRKEINSSTETNHYLLL